MTLPDLLEITAESLGTAPWNGKEYPIKPLDGYGYRLSQTAQGDDEKSIDITYRLAARCIGVQYEELFGTEQTIGMPLKEAARIVAIASGQIQNVEASASPLSEAAAKTATG